MLSVLSIVATDGVVSLTFTASSLGLRASRSRKSSLIIKQGNLLLSQQYSSQHWIQVQVIYWQSKLYFLVDQRRYCERLEPKCHFICRLSMIVWVNVALNRTIIDSDWHFDNLCGQSSKVSKWVVSRQLMVFNSGY